MGGGLRPTAVTGAPVGEAEGGRKAEGVGAPVPAPVPVGEAEGAGAPVPVGEAEGAGASVPVGEAEGVGAPAVGEGVGRPTRARCVPSRAMARSSTTTKDRAGSSPTTSLCSSMLARIRSLARVMYCSTSLTYAAGLPRVWLPRGLALPLAVPLAAGGGGADVGRFAISSSRFICTACARSEAAALRVTRVRCTSLVLSTGDR